MKRPLSVPERFMWGDGVSPFNGVLTARIKGELSLEGLHGALLRVQEVHPLLRSVITEDARGRPFFELCASPAPIPVRTRERKTDEDWIDASMQSWTTVFDGRRGPMMDLVWLRAPGVSELLMTFHHCFCDGRGALRLMQDLLTFLDGPHPPGREAGQGGTPCAPTHMVALDDLIPSAVRNNKGRRIRAYLQASLVRWVVGAGLMSKRRATPIPRDKDYFLHWKWTEEASAGLFQACQRAGVTVNTALCAAFLTAFRTVRGRKAHNRITCPVDIRKYLPGIEDTLFPIGLSMTLTLDKKPPASFWDKAVLLQKAVAKKSKRMDPYGFLMTMENLHGAVHSIRKALAQAKPGQDCMFSNLGRMNIPWAWSTFELDTLYSFSVLGPLGDPTTVVTSTYRDRLDFALVSNETFLTRVEAEAIRQEAMDLLQKALV
jgi:NRPS condensation-like uncharacterized protein